jgi:hypothetical protein
MVASVFVLLLLVPTILFIYHTSGGAAEKANSDFAMKLSSSTEEVAKSQIGSIFSISEKLSDDQALTTERKALLALISKGEDLSTKNGIKGTDLDKLKEALNKIKPTASTLDLAETRKSSDTLKPLVTTAENQVKEAEERQKLFATTNDLIKKGQTLVNNEFITGQNKTNLDTNIQNAVRMVQKNNDSLDAIKEFNGKFESSVKDAQTIVDGKNKEKEDNEKRKSLFDTTLQLIDEAHKLLSNSKTASSEKVALDDSILKAEKMIRDNTGEISSIQNFNKSFLEQLKTVSDNINKRD